MVESVTTANTRNGPQPRVPPGLSRLSDMMKDALRTNATGRLESMRSMRLPWWAHWSLLAEMFLPRRYRWFIQPTQWVRGSPMNQSIVDETGLVAARVLATGMLADLTDPTKPWFKLGIAGQGPVPPGPLADELANRTRILLDIYGASNFYESQGIKFHDAVVFGTGNQIQYEDPDTVVRFVNPCLGEFFNGVDATNRVDSQAREYTYTCKQTVEEFGLANVSGSTANSYMSGNGAQWDQEIVIGHLIEPNACVFRAGANLGYPVPPHFKYREVFWEWGGPGTQRNTGTLLRVRGFREKPFVSLRWDVTSNDCYGRSPGMDALPAVRQLQLEQRRKAEAIDKMVRPPMVGSVTMKNEPADITAGGITYVADPAGAGFKPAFTVEPRIAEMMEDIKEVQDRVRTVMFNDLFNRFPTDSKVQTATWVDAANQEKLILLGPVVERTQSEDLDDTIARTYAIAQRRGLFRPFPALDNAPVTVSYISLLAQAQRAAFLAGLERWVGFGGNLVGVQPDVMDNYKVDDIVEEYGTELNVPPHLIRAMKDIAAIRAARTQAQQQAAALNTTQTLAQAGQTLSQTDVGGGKNALQSVLGGGNV